VQIDFAELSDASRASPTSSLWALRLRKRGIKAEFASPLKRRKSNGLEHDPEKWEPVFGKDHAPTISWSGMTIRRKVIPL
jgi:hypothetical protein